MIAMSVTWVTAAERESVATIITAVAKCRAASYPRISMKIATIRAGEQKEPGPANIPISYTTPRDSARTATSPITTKSAKQSTLRTSHCLSLHKFLSLSSMLSSNSKWLLRQIKSNNWRIKMPAIQRLKERSMRTLLVPNLKARSRQSSTKPPDKVIIFRQDQQYKQFFENSNSTNLLIKFAVIQMDWGKIAAS